MRGGAPPERHLFGETTAGNTILIYLINMIAPTAFAAFVAATGRFDLAFMIAAVCCWLSLPLLWGVDRRL